MSIQVENPPVKIHPADSPVLILSAAAKLIEENGEAGFRIADLVKVSGRSVGSIYHFYGNREGVVEAVRAHQFNPTWDEDFAMMRSLAQGIHTRDEALEAISTLVVAFQGADRADQLWSRVEVIGAARARPELRHVLAQKQSSMTADYAELISLLKSRGLLDDDLDVWAAAVFVQAITIGRIVSLIDGTGQLSDDEWVAIVKQFIGSIVRDAPTDR